MKCTEMNLNDVFPSNYLKAADLQGRDVNVTIKTYGLEKLGEEQKLVLYFQGKEKGLVCNRTNADRIAHYYGADLDQWMGKQLTLGTELVSFQGKTSEAIRVKGRPSAPAEGASAAPAATADRPFDDQTIPF
ncbi:hypothetical protein Rleg2_1132 [Rhizobium leguminosarum bv. trifolii WSM2304]|uniref:DUF3127 domain-containing protein n=2 Tax=Rhizobium leguminosarum TaxID=384 RepID=A0ABF7QKA9_RHILW|nr:hypothetical protein Rleg2_1132 [Rhizobium leguminosarum bv. trifolii WSM2304]